VTDDSSLGKKGRGDPIAEDLDDVLTAPTRTQTACHHDGDVIHPCSGGMFEDTLEDGASDVEAHPRLHRIDIPHHEGQLHAGPQQLLQGCAVDGIGEGPLHQSDGVRGGNGLRGIDHLGSDGETLQTDSVPREGEQLWGVFVDLQSKTGAAHDGSFHLGCIA